MGRPAGGPSARPRSGSHLGHAFSRDRRLLADPGTRGTRAGSAGGARASSRASLYALPTALLVAVFFIVPILLVARMSASDWELLRGDDGHQPAGQLRRPPGQQPLLRGRRLHDPLHDPRHDHAHRAGASASPCSCRRRTRWSGILRTAFLLPVALGLASASLLALGPLLAGDRADQPDAPVGWASSTSRCPFFGTPLAALLSTTFLIVWKYVGLYMLILLVGLQLDPRRGAGGRRDRRRRPLADVPTHHSCRCCGHPSPWRSSCA